MGIKEVLLRRHLHLDHFILLPCVVFEIARGSNTLYLGLLCFTVELEFVKFGRL